MNTALLKDPVVLGAGCVILVGFILFVWAIRKLMGGSSAAASPANDFEFQLPPRPVTPTPPPPTARPLSVVSPETNPFANAAPPAQAAPPAVSRDVLDKVDLISQRLVDMQMLLNKQLSASSATQGGGGALSLSPDMLEKLVKLMGSVVEQVEVLQKNMSGAAPETHAANPSGTPPAGA